MPNSVVLIILETIVFNSFSSTFKGAAAQLPVFFCISGFGSAFLSTFWLTVRGILSICIMTAGTI